MTKTPLVRLTPKGLYCEVGDFYIDPIKPVKKALLTHAHADHARKGSNYYLAVNSSVNILRHRLGQHIAISGCAYGETFYCNGVKISFHPAGHILGSAQIRLEHRGKIWVISGDYKTSADATCEAFNPIRCHTFITETTFALPVYRWRPQAEIFQSINGWWHHNQSQNKASILMGYSLGKAQRLLSGLNDDIGPIYIHDSVERINYFYREQGIKLPKTIQLTSLTTQKLSPGIIIVPPSSATKKWLSGFDNFSLAFASGWMQSRKYHQGHILNNGFVLSDHADWPGLLNAIRETGAEQIFAMHGKCDVLLATLQKQGYQASELSCIEPLMKKSHSINQMQLEL